MSKEQRQERSGIRSGLPVNHEIFAKDIHIDATPLAAEMERQGVSFGDPKKEG